MDNIKTRTLVFLLLFFFFITVLSQNQCNKNDENTLLKIKKSLNNPKHLATWDSKTDCCTWNYLECSDVNAATTTANNRRVISITLISAQISGQIPPEVGDLPYLQKLVFRKITNLTGQIPVTIAKLKHLRFLRISWTNLTGPVPEFLTQLVNLDYLNLSYNNFSGSIPGSLSLRFIDLSRNKLTGTIPESFGSFNGDILLSHNQLSGYLPKSLGNLDLNRIDFSRNKLEGDASFLFGANKTTSYVDLSRNMFEFDLSKVEIPKTIGTLDLNHNRITGNIPVQWTEDTPLLRGFNVSYNRLCGKIPNGGNLQKFDSFAYFHNKCLCGAPLESCK